MGNFKHAGVGERTTRRITLEIMLCKGYMRVIEGTIATHGKQHLVLTVGNFTHAGVGERTARHITLEIMLCKVYMRLIEGTIATHDEPAS